MSGRHAKILVGWLKSQTARWMNSIEFILWQARVLSIALRHPRVPFTGKLAAAIAVAYVFSPIQLIPTFIPIIGQLDDVVFLLGAMKVIRKSTSPEILAECEAKANASFSWINFSRPGQSHELVYIDAIQPPATDPRIAEGAHEHEWSSHGAEPIQLKVPPEPASISPSCS